MIRAEVVKSYDLFYIIPEVSVFETLMGDEYALITHTKGRIAECSISRVAVHGNIVRCYCRHEYHGDVSFTKDVKSAEIKAGCVRVEFEDG